MARWTFHRGQSSRRSSIRRRSCQLISVDAGNCLNACSVPSDEPNFEQVATVSADSTVDGGTARRWKPHSLTRWKPRAPNPSLVPLHRISFSER